jgi:hypothetical protein
MLDSKFPAGCEEALRRPPKSGVATATSTGGHPCTPTCGCSIRPRSPARPRARRFGAPSSRGFQPTATAALTRATSGAFALSALRERRDPDRLRARPANAPEREVAREMLVERVPLAGVPSSPTRASLAPSSRAGWPIAEPSSFVPIARTSRSNSDRSGACPSGSNRSFGPARDSWPRAPRHGHIPGPVPASGCRLLALAAGLRHNAEIGQPGQCFSAYGH